MLFGFFLLSVAGIAFAMTDEDDTSSDQNTSEVSVED